MYFSYWNNNIFGVSRAQLVAIIVAADLTIVCAYKIFIAAAVQWLSAQFIHEKYIHKYKYYTVRWQRARAQCRKISIDFNLLSGIGHLKCESSEFLFSIYTNACTETATDRKSCGELCIAFNGDLVVDVPYNVPR